MYKNMKCPYCDKYVDYHPNCTQRTAKDWDKYGWTISKGKYKTKHFFHLDCYEKEVLKNKQK